MTLDITSFLTGLALGAVVAIVVYAVMRTQARAAREAMDASRTAMSHEFQALASQALGANSDQFLKVLQERFRSWQGESVTDLEKRQAAINELVKPVNTQLETMNALINQIKGTDESLNARLLDLQRETAKVAGALNNPRERGRSAEHLLERLFEYAGLVRDIHYSAQVSGSAGGNNVRPDFVITLEDGLNVVVDAKAPLVEILDDMENPERQADIAARLARQVRSHIKDLAGKKYTDLKGSVNFTVLFLPGDGLYAMAVDADRELIDFAAQNRIVLASPMLLFGLLRMVHMIGRQAAFNKNAESIQKAGAELHKRLHTFFGHFQKIGRAIATLNGGYNDAVGSMERNVMPKARQFEELQGIPAADALPEMQPVEAAPRIALDEKAA